jgi:rhodanese-related sulfurtransferase
VKSSTIKEAIIITIAATALGLFNNWRCNPNPLPWLHESRHVESASNTLLDSMLNVSTNSQQIDTTNRADRTDMGNQKDVKEITTSFSSKPQSGKDTVKKSQMSVSTKSESPSTGLGDKSKGMQTPPMNDAVQTDPKLPVAINYDQVMKLVKNGATFLDARKSAEHEKGSIPGSKNIDILEFQSNPNYRNQCMQLLYSLPKDKIVVAYCGGGNCELSHELCDILIPMEFKHVLIYLGGWNEYTERQGIKK